MAQTTQYRVGQAFVYADKIYSKDEIIDGNDYESLPQQQRDLVLVLNASPRVADAGIEVQKASQAAAANTQAAQNTAPKK